MGHSKHIWRAALILGLALAAVISGRHFMVPDTFGLAGHYRYSALEEFREQEPLHGGKESCKKCHEEQYAAHAKGKHAALNCEVCHGPVATHAQVGQDAPADPKAAYLAEMPKNPSYTLCAYCHQKQAARPKSMKQVQFRKHLEEQGLKAGGKMAERVCLKCHQAHDPAGSTAK